jgi:hypothetical protein
MAQRGFVIPWYATGFRGDAFEAALQEIAPIALRYGATSWTIYRLQDDRYRFQQYSLFEDPHDFDLYWYGPEFVDWRAQYSSWYQVPVVYAPVTLVATAHVGPEPNGNGNGAPGVSPARAEP